MLCRSLMNMSLSVIRYFQSTVLVHKVVGSKKSTEA